MKKNTILDSQMYFGATPEILCRASELRKNMTFAEKILWQKIRKDQLGASFRRHHAINSFIADFYCHSKKLVIELDGSVHETSYQAEHDVEHDKIMLDYGLTVLRFTNNEIEKDLNDVIKKIRTYL